MCAKTVVAAFDILKRAERPQKKCVRCEVAQAPALLSVAFLWAALVMCMPCVWRPVTVTCYVYSLNWSKGTYVHPLQCHEVKTVPQVHMTLVSLVVLQDFCYCKSSIYKELYIVTKRTVKGTESFTKVV